VEILPAILATSMDDLVRKLRAVEGLVEMVHVDIMDGKFVMNRTIQARELTNASPKVAVQVHLMAFKPESYIADFARLADEFVFHAEATDEHEHVARACRTAGMKPGIAFNPDTPISEVDAAAAKAFDVALVMSVHPGASGQEFIPDVLEKIKELRTLNPKLRIGIDGGIKTGTCCLAAKAGADFVAAASAIYGKKDLKSAITELEKDARCGPKKRR
jgi:ribulose-phosphate 3-epimerase